MTNLQAIRLIDDKMIRWKYEEMTRCQDDDMAWWHCDIVTSKAKVAKDCQKMANIGKNCQTVAKIDLSDKKFIKVAKNLWEMPKVAKKIPKSAQRGLNLPTV